MSKNEVELSTNISRDASNSKLCESTDNNVGLQRNIGLVGANAVLVGTIIGSGIFASPASVYNHTNSPGGALLVWAGCGLLAMCASLSWLELGCMYPNLSGGEYSYIMKAFGPVPAFVYAFVNVIATRPASICLIAITCGDYIIEAVDPNAHPGYSKIIAAALIGLSF